MREIILTKGKVALVDDEDYEWLSRWKWQFCGDGYARRTSWDHGKSIVIIMHRIITDCPKDLEVDHLNGNRLDNRRANLRTVSHRQNAKNLGVRKTCTSGVPGVYWEKDKKCWKAHIMVDGKKMHLGYSKLLYVAAKMRKDAERKYGFYDRGQKESLVRDLNS